MPPSSAQVPTILEKIGAYKLDEIADAKQARPLAELEAQAGHADAPRGFYRALKSKVADGQYGLICEIKKASPSKGLIRVDFFPGQLAEAYFKGGATCLSVLTDGPSFQGSPDYLIEARGRVPLPVLRKDFMYDPYQVLEARAMGADCILIILAAVSDAQAQELEETAHAWNMDVLLEVHNRDELTRALHLKSPLLGINNRDLNTFETSLETTGALAHHVPKDRLMVSESGIATAHDLAQLSGMGANCFLIGESLMRQDDVEVATRQLANAKQVI